MFSDRPFGELAQDGELVDLVLAGLDYHEDPNGEYGEFEDIHGAGVEKKDRDGQVPEHRAQHHVDNQPSDEEIKALKGVESRQAVMTVSLGR